METYGWSWDDYEATPEFVLARAVEVLNERATQRSMELEMARARRR